MRSWQLLLLVALTACNPKAEDTASSQPASTPSSTPDEAAPTAPQPAGGCATTNVGRTQELISLVDQACGCETDTACTEAASKRADAWNECARSPANAEEKEALWLEDEQIQTVFAMTDKLKACNIVVYRILVATEE